MPFDFDFDELDYFDFEKDPGVPEEYKKKKKESSWLEDFMSFGSAESDMYVRPEPLPNPKPTAEERVPKLSAAEPETIWQKVAGTIDDFVNPRTAGTMAPADIADAQIKMEARKNIVKDKSDDGKTIFRPQYKEEFMDEVDPDNAGVRKATQLFKDVGVGALSTAEGIAGGAEWLTNGIIGNDLANQAKLWGQDLSAEEQGFSNQLAQGVGSMGTFFIPGIGVMKGATALAKVSPNLAKWMGAGTMTAMEAMTEAGSVYRDVLHETKDPARATLAATEAFTLNIPLLTITNKLGMFGESGTAIKRALVSSLMEGGQEAGQEIISTTSAGKPVKWGDVLTSGAIGAIIGGGTGALAHGAMDDDQKTDVDKATTALGVPDNGTDSSFLVKRLIENGNLDDVKYALAPENAKLWTPEERAHLERHYTRLQATEAPAAKLDKTVDDHLQGKTTSTDLLDTFAGEFDNMEDLLREEPADVNARKIRYGDKQPELDLGTSSMPLFDATNLSSPSEIVAPGASGEAVKSPINTDTSASSIIIERRGAKEGGFYAPEGESLADFGEQTHKFELTDTSKIYKGEASYEFVKDRVDMNASDPILDEYGLKNWQQFFDDFGLYEVGNDKWGFSGNENFKALQDKAQQILQAQGYKGAEWSDEDMLNPHQYQIWDKSILKEPGTAKQPAFADMVKEAARWRGAAMNVDEALGTNKKARLAHSNMTTKGDLDAYLMKKFGIDATTARDVSNELTKQNIPADRSAKTEEFANEPWAKTTGKDMDVSKIVTEEYEPYSQKNPGEGGNYEWKRVDRSQIGKTIKQGPEADYEDYTIDENAAYGQVEVTEFRPHEIEARKKRGIDINEKTKTAITNSFELAPDLRGKGLGRKLWQKIEDDARKHGAERMEIWHVMSDATGFWRKMGFKPIAGGSEDARTWVKEKEDFLPKAKKPSVESTKKGTTVREDSADYGAGPKRSALLKQWRIVMGEEKGNPNPNLPSDRWELESMLDEIDKNEKQKEGFYSNTEEMLNKQNETAMPPAEWKKRIEAWGQKFAGIREENQWSGLLEYIDSRSDEKKIPKADLLEYMEETKKGWLQQENEPDERWSSRNLPGGIPGTEQMWIYSMPGGVTGHRLHRDIMTEPLTAQDLEDLESIDEVALLPLSDSIEEGSIKPGDWGHFDADGGALLYATQRRHAATREKAQQDFITYLEEMEYDSPMLISADADTYSSPHFPHKPNVLLHIRTQKMRDSEGRIGIVAETIQSDWHQEGRKTGYVENLAALNAQIAALRKEKEDFIHAHGKSSNYGGMTFLEVVAEAQTFDARIGELLERTRSGVPDAPFKDTWHEQGLKRLIDIAAKDPEVEWLGWTPGEAQAERWGKSQKRYIGKVEYTEVEPGKYSLVVQWKPPWTRTEDRDADKFRVQNAFGDLDKIKMEWGAEVADAIRNKEGLLDEATETQDERGIAELNRNVSAGGDYLKLLYDKKLPKFADKYVKKWGAKVEEIPIDTGRRPNNKELEDLNDRFHELTATEHRRREELQEELDEQHGYENVHAITITPQMRKEIVEKGQAFYEPKASYADKAIEQLGRIVNLYNAKGISGLGLFDRSKQSADRNAAGVRGKETRHHTVGKLVDDLKALKPVRLRGAEVKGWDDVYEALRITRNKNVEILQVLYIGEESGKILYNEACSSRLPGAVQIASPEILAAAIRSTTMKMERLSQENVRVVLAHNHPSGDVTASDADIAMTKNMAKLINRYGIQFDGHIVINHNKYNAISGKGDAVKRSITDVPAEHAKDPLLTIPIPHEKLGATLSRQDHVASIAKDINRGDKYFTILMRSGIKVRGIVNVELEILDDPQKATEYIRELMVNHGAQDSFVYCENFTRDQIETLVDLVKGNTLRDAAWEAERRTTSLLEQGIYPDSRKQFGKDIEDYQGDWLEDYDAEFQEERGEYGTETDSIIKEAKENGTYLKAPNGEPTKLNPGQWAQVRTKAFKEWFGDWENDPKNASKVVDENGEPLVVYHGTDADFETFKDEDGIGMYFSPDPEHADAYADVKGRQNGPARGDNVKPVFLNIQNPARRHANLTEYDGIITRDAQGNMGFVAVFEPSQIKSATANRGTFDANEGSILKEENSPYTNAKESGSVSPMTSRKGTGDIPPKTTPKPVGGKYYAAYPTNQWIIFQDGNVITRTGLSFKDKAKVDDEVGRLNKIRIDSLPVKKNPSTSDEIRQQSILDIPGYGKPGFSIINKDNILNVRSASAKIKIAIDELLPSLAENEYFVLRGDYNDSVARKFRRSGNYVDDVRRGTLHGTSVVDLPDNPTARDVETAVYKALSYGPNIYLIKAKGQSRAGNDFWNDEIIVPSHTIAGKPIDAVSETIDYDLIKKYFYPETTPAPEAGAAHRPVRPESKQLPNPSRPPEVGGRVSETNSPYGEDEGKGWFYNRELDKLVEIDKGDLGPHGDHDGWISIGDNAEKMGVKDAHGARAFQAATYGIDTEQYPQFEKWAEGGYVFTQDDSIADDPKFQRTFKKVFGTDLDTARWTRFPELTRVRYYPAKDKHYPHGRAVMDIDRLDAATMTSLKKMVPKLKLHPDTVVIIYREDGPSIEIPKSEFANVRNAYDLKKYSVKVVRDKDAPYGEDLDEPPLGDEDDSFDFGSNVEQAIDENPEEYISLDFKDHLDGYMDSLQGLVIQGEPGKKISDDVTGEAIWWSSTYPEFMQDQGWTQKEVLSALSHSIKGEEMTEKQRAIVQAAVNQAVDMFYEDLQRWYPNLKGNQYDKAEASIRKATDAFLSRYYTNQKLLKEEKEKADRATMITKSKYQWEKEKKNTETKAWLKGSEAVHSVQDPIITKLQDDLEATTKQRDRLRETTYQLMDKEKTLNREAKEKGETALNDIRKLNNKIERLKESLEKARKAKPRGMKKSTKALIRIATGQNLNDEVWISEYKLLTEQIRREAMAARQAFASGNKEGLLKARARYKMMQAQQRAMREIKRNTNKIIKDFKKVLKQTSEMTPEYAEKIKSLLEDFDLAKMTGEARLKLEAIREALIENPDADIDERTLDTLKRLEKIPIRNISYPGLKAMHEAVMHFATLGKRGPTMIMSQKKVTRDMILQRSIDAMKSAKEVAKDMIPDATYSGAKDIKSRLSAIKDLYTIHLDTFDNLVESIAGMNSMVYRVLMREIKRGSNERDRIAYELEDEFMAAQEAFQKRHSEIKDVLGWLSEDVTFAGIKMNRNQALSLYRGWFDPDYQRSIIESGFGLWGSQDRNNPNKVFKVSGDAYGSSVYKLSRAEREYADLAIPTINKSGDLLADKFLEINGYAMPRVEDGIYWRKEVLASERGQDEEQEQMKERFGRPYIFKGMTKKRTGSSAAVWLKPYTVAVREMHKRAADYVGLEEAMSNAAWLMYNKEFKAEIEARYGLPIWREMEKGLKDIAEISTPEAKGDIERFFRWLRNNSTIYALAANYGTMLKQLNGAFNYMVYVGPGYLTRAISAYASDPMAVKRLHRSMSVEYRRRRESGYSQDVGNVLRVINKQGTKPSTITRIGAGGLVPLQQMDIFGVDLGMLAATYQAMDAFKAKKMPDQMRMALDMTDAQVARLTPAEKTELAYRWADFVTERTQSQNVPEHMSGWQRGGELEKQLSMFFGELQKNLAGFARACRSVKRGDPGAKALLLKTILLYAILGTAIDAGVNELRNRLRGRKGDKWWASLIKSVSGYLPGIREVVSAAVDMAQGKYYAGGGDTPYERVRNAAEKPLKATKGMITATTPKKRWENAKKLADGTANFVAMTVGIPYPAMKEPFRIWNREEELRKQRAAERR